jgi:oligo-1,6-glucosidase/alpha-glucosidase
LVFLFEFTSTEFNAKKFATIIKKINRLFPYPYTPTWVLGNHDRMRYISRISNDLSKARILATLQLTLRGTAFIYYGEEIGMKDVKFKLKNSKDPIGRQFWWSPISRVKQIGFSLTRDGCRTPMQWNEDPHAGFSPNTNASPWLKVADNYEKVNVANEKEDPNSLLNCYKELLEIRKKNIAIQEGGLDSIKIKGDDNCLAYRRVHPSQEVYIYLNLSDKTLSVDIPNGEVKLLFSTIPNRREFPIGKQDQQIRLVGYEGIILGT